MWKYRGWAALAGILFLCLRFAHGFGAVWSRMISLPVLRILAVWGGSVPFVLLEWGFAGICVFLLLRLVQRRFLRSFACMALGLVIGFLALWYPLYFTGQDEYTADASRIASLSDQLIDELNASSLAFDEMDDPPAKFVRFPGWMDMLGVSGICSFLTGEALISPELPPASIPFVAVHERMHLQGHAGEGDANIAAWRDCMARGGVYADSARLWALRYSMGMLKRDAYDLYEGCLARMNYRTLQFYREAGGAYSPAPLSAFLQRLYAALDIETAMQDYEILAPYLAAELP